MPAAAIEHPQREIVAAIAASGLTPDEEDLAQLARAIRSQRMNYVAAVGGTANALTATLDPAPAALADLVGMPIRLLVATTNTGAATLNVNGLGAKAIVYPGGAPLSAGELIATGLAEVIYSASADAFVLVTPTVAQRGRQIFVANGTFTAPHTGKFFVRVIGAGGGGGSAATGSSPHGNFTGGAGGGGGVAEGFVYLTKGQTVTVTVGAGGVGASASVASTAGGSSSFGAYMSATGGTQGLSAGAAVLQGGISGTGVGGDVNYGLGDGSPGAELNASVPSLIAPGTGGGPGGQTGAGSGVAGFPGKGPGGGGGGTGRHELGSVAGAGFRGQVEVSW